MVKTATAKERSDLGYAAKDITVLEGLEAVRKRPGMYIGSTGLEGIQHLIHEIVDNGVDEAMAGWASAIHVKIHANGAVTVVDDGRGIPVDTHHRTGKSALETVMTTLHAGGKFGDKGYQVSGGLHGVGASVVNALSEWLKVEVMRDGKIYSMAFEKGKTVGELTARDQQNGATRTGTKVTWMPDKSIFPEIDYSFEAISQRFKEVTYMNSKLKITFESDWHLASHWPNNHVSYYFDGGIKAFVRNINRRRGGIHPNIYTVSTTLNDIAIDVAMQYNESFAESCFAFANCIRTGDGGTHVTGVRTALTRVINEFARKKASPKDNINSLSGEDAREGLVYVISVKVKNPQFEGQTKGRLGNPEVKGAVEQAVGRSLTEFLEDNPLDLDAILNKAFTAARARLAAKKARDMIIRKNAMDGGSLPGKLADCTEKRPERSELFLVEGESAGGTAKQGRDRYFQAILPLKGKILNVEKARPDKMLSHDEIVTIITAIGAGIGDDFNYERLRYGKVIIMTDADVDGSHIRALLLTFFFRNMSKLIEGGNLYIAQPPLYRASKGRSFEWLYNDDDLQRYFETKLFAGLRIVGADNGADSRPFTANGAQINKLREFKQALLNAGLNDLDDKQLADALNERLEANNSRDAAFNHAQSAMDFETPTAPTPAGSGALLGDWGGAEADARKRAARIYADIANLVKQGAFVISREDKVIAADIHWRDLVAQLDKLADRAGIAVQRYKGLGEMNADQLWETTMNPADRQMSRVKIEDAARADEIFNTLMGDEVEPRRNFIRANATSVRNLDI